MGSWLALSRFLCYLTVTAGFAIEYLKLCLFSERSYRRASSLSFKGLDLSTAEHTSTLSYPLEAYLMILFHNLSWLVPAVQDKSRQILFPIDLPPKKSSGPGARGAHQTKSGLDLERSNRVHPSQAFSPSNQHPLPTLSFLQLSRVSREACRSAHVRCH